MLQVPFNKDRSFYKMGGCSCKKRKLCKTNTTELLPSKLLLARLISGYKNKIEKKEEIPEEQTQTENEGTRQKDQLNSSLTDLEEKKHILVHRRSSSTSSLPNRYNSSPKIIIHQNIIIRPSYLTNKKKDDIVTRENSIENPVSVTNYTKLSVVGNSQNNVNNYHLKDSFSIKSNGCIESTSTHIYNGNKNVKSKTILNLANMNQPITITNEKCSKKGHGTINNKKQLAGPLSNLPLTQQNDGRNCRGKNHTIKITKILDAKNVTKLAEIENYVTANAKNAWEDEGSLYGASLENDEIDSTISSLTSIFNTACFLEDTNNRFSYSSTLSEDNSDWRYSSEAEYSYLNRYSITYNLGIPSPCKTNKILKNLIRKEKHCCKANISYVGDIYNVEYLEDMFEYIRILEKKTVLANDFLNDYNPNQMHRSKIVNWMLRIQTELYFSNSEFYVAVYLLDKVLGNIYIPKNMYKLLAISTIWIAIKLCGSDDVTASILVDLSQECYTVDQLLKMEQNVLQLTNFQVYTIEPSLCVSYYIKLLNLRHDNLVILSVFYALDFLSLLPEFSSTPTSLSAAAAISFIQSIFSEKTKVKMYGFFRKIFSEEEIEVMRSLEVLLYIQLKNMTDENYMYKEPYNKYKMGNSMSISEFLNDMV